MYLKIKSLSNKKPNYYTICQKIYLISNFILSRFLSLILKKHQKKNKYKKVSIKIGLIYQYDKNIKYLDKNKYKWHDVSSFSHTEKSLKE